MRESKREIEIKMNWLKIFSNENQTFFLQFSTIFFIIVLYFKPLGLNLFQIKIKKINFSELK
jgi:hypothetical protein